MQKRFLTGALILVSLASIIAQELNFKVSVQTQSSINAISNDPSFYRDLEKKLNEFVNTTKWTDDEYQQEERIKGALQLTITEEIQGSGFKGEIIWQTERPVYNSTYSSPIISLIDKNVSFSYNDLQPLLKTNSTYYDNLSSIISFYCYYTLGMDYDSFSLNGGEQSFAKAQEIITSLPSGVVRDEGWRNDGGGRRNRYWLIENILSPKMRQFRQAFYEYHRVGLDKMYDESDKCRAILLSTLTAIGQANIDYPNTYLIQFFGDAKKDEIVEIFKLGDSGQKAKVKGIMVGMDFTKTEKYSVLN